MDVHDREQGDFGLDAWLALLAGPAPWSDVDEPGESWVRTLSYAQLLAFAATGSVLAARWTPGSPFPWAMTAALLGLAALATQPLLCVAGRPPVSRSMYGNVVARSVFTAAVVVGVAALLPHWQAVLATTFAVAIGLDGALTCERLGWQARPLPWYLNVLRSSFHLGIVGALVAAVVARAPLAVIVTVYVTLHVGLAATMVTLRTTRSLRRDRSVEQRAAIDDALGAERRARAHWLHDDVCAHLRLVSLKIQTGAAGSDELLRLLDDFDHELRLRQLDELLGTGAIRVGELLQPYIRNVQNHGVRIVGVPSFEDAAMDLPEHAARRASRAMKVLTSNALNAGASTISYEVRRSEHAVHLTVHDDATGFDLADVPHGRGLWSLIEELRPGGIEVVRNGDGGASVTAHVLLDSGRVRGHAAAR